MREGGGGEGGGRRWGGEEGKGEGGGGRKAKERIFDVICAFSHVIRALAFSVVFTG